MPFSSSSRDLTGDPAARVSVFILGFGAFGRLLAEALSPYARLTVSDPSQPAQQAARRLGLTLCGPEAAGGHDIVILAGPTQRLTDQLAAIAPHLVAGQVVLDVCSVKAEPARLMRALLPAGVEIIGTHPMFGPSSLSRRPSAANA